MGSNKPIRVAHVIGKLNAAGVEAVVNNYYRNIDHNKYQFDFIVDSDGECQPRQELIDLGARYYIVPPYQNVRPHIKELIRLFKENQYSIVHTGMNTLAPISMYCAWKAKVPIRINHNHSTAGVGETKKNILKYCLRPFAKCFANYYAACSIYSGEWLFGKKMMNNGLVTVFNNAIDIELYKYDRRIRNAVRNELNIKEKFVIGHVGRFEYQKNHDFLIDVFNSIHKENANTVLMLVGIGKLMDDIKNKVAQLGLSDAVLFLGSRNDVNRLYQSMDVFVLPSHYEGLPVVGVEAQAAGVPCVFSNQMTKEIVVIKDTLVLPLTLSPSEWAKRILDYKTVEHQDTSVDLRAAGFDIKTEAKKLELFYDNALANLKK